MQRLTYIQNNHPRRPLKPRSLLAPQQSSLSKTPRQLHRKLPRYRLLIFPQILPIFRPNRYNAIPTLTSTSEVRVTCEYLGDPSGASAVGEEGAV